MSRIGKLPVKVISGVSVVVNTDTVVVKGKKGELSFDIPFGISVKVENGFVFFERNFDDKKTKSFHGLARAIVSNMIEGVSKGFEKRLEIVGVGYRAVANGVKIDLNLGFSHQISLVAPKGVSVNMSEDKKEKNVIIVSGCDKQAVGEFAANIRKLRKPEPYKGKGIRYQGEYIRRKAGKSAS